MRRDELLAILLCLSIALSMILLMATHRTPAAELLSALQPADLSLEVEDRTAPRR